MSTVNKLNSGDTPAPAGEPYVSRTNPSASLWGGNGKFSKHAGSPARAHPPMIPRAISNACSFNNRTSDFIVWSCLENFSADFPIRRESPATALRFRLIPTDSGAAFPPGLPGGKTVPGPVAQTFNRLTSGRRYGDTRPPRRTQHPATERWIPHPGPEEEASPSLAPSPRPAQRLQPRRARTLFCFSCVFSAYGIPTPLKLDPYGSSTMSIRH